MHDYLELEKLIGIKFSNVDLIDTAFVHKSSLNEKRLKKEHNERMEFLGDAVLELVVTEYLYLNFPNPEGDLTNWRSALVKGKNLAQIAKRLGLGTYLYLSKGEEKSGGRDKDYILANTLEAFIGAIFLDKDYEVARQFILKNIMGDLQKIIDEELHIDPKSKLQELIQERLNITPEYKVMNEDGPDHSKTFTMGAYIKDKLIGQGAGKSKQEAERQAAQDALEKML